MMWKWYLLWVFMVLLLFRWGLLQVRQSKWKRFKLHIPHQKVIPFRKFNISQNVHGSWGKEEMNPSLIPEVVVKAVLLLIITVAINQIINYPIPCVFGAWLTAWNYRKSHALTSVVGGGNNNKVGIKVYFGAGTDGTESIDGVTWGKVYVNGKCETDFADFRPTDDDEITVLDHTLIEKTDSSYAMFWVEVADDMSSNQTIYIYYGNSGVSSASDIQETFSIFGEGFDVVSVDADYLTTWTKSGNNPLQTGYNRGWMCACYSNYGNEDKIYIFINRDDQPNLTVQCWSFTRANADTPGSWTDHGVVYTATEAWESNYIEPHGIIFETQAMADAREDVGVGEGTKKWRLYYTATTGATPTLAIGFATASESDLTSWTAYASNPVFPKNTIKTGWGYADNKTCIFDNKVWIHMGWYKVGVAVDPSHFIVSDDGISDWQYKNMDLETERVVAGATVALTDGIFMIGQTAPSPYQIYDAYFTTNGLEMRTYSGNPMLSGGAVSAWDEYLGACTIVIDKDGSPDLNGAGTYYLYYNALPNGGVSRELGLATSTTLTEEDNQDTTLEDRRWTVTSGTISITSGRLKIIGDGSGVDKVEKDYFLQPPEYVVEGEVEMAQTNQDWNAFCVLVNDGDASKMGLTGKADGYIYYLNDTGWVKSSQTYSANTRYRWKIIVDEANDQGDYWFNGVELANAQTFFSAGDDPSILRVNQSANTSTLYQEYIFIREDIDPGHGAWGAEEEAPLGAKRGGASAIVAVMQSILCMWRGMSKMVR